MVAFEPGVCSYSPAPGRLGDAFDECEFIHFQPVTPTKISELIALKST